MLRVSRDQFKIFNLDLVEAFAILNNGNRAILIKRIKIVRKIQRKLTRVSRDQFKIFNLDLVESVCDIEH